MFNISNHGVELIELDTGSPVGGINTYLIFGESEREQRDKLFILKKETF